ncbi:hypothetical protein Tco_1378891 [Tanacetum coccineum]
MSAALSFFRGRSSPKALCNVISQLKANQKACLEETGFGGMVEFRVDDIPSKLWLYVVDNFDETKMEIKFSTGYIVITKDLIREMLGLKNEGIDVLEGTPNKNDEMVRSWMNQYESGKELTPVDVRIRLRKSKDVDMNSKLNFIMSYVDGKKCNYNILYRKRPPTKVWTAKLLSEREVEELNSGGFGHGEIEEAFFDEEGDPISNNI